MPTKAAIKRWQIKRRETRRKLLQDIKSNTPCADCSNKFPWYLMDFDHVPEMGSKCFGLNEAMSHPCISDERFFAELEKCDVVCCMCHRTREYVRSADKALRIADSRSAGVADSPRHGVI